MGDTDVARVWGDSLGMGHGSQTICLTACWAFTCPFQDWGPYKNGGLEGLGRQGQGNREDTGKQTAHRSGGLNGNLGVCLRESQEDT